MREAEEANRKKLAALEAEQQKLKEEERKELEAQIAKVKSDATIDCNAKQQKITELTNKLAQMEKDVAEKGKQIADNIARARKSCNDTQGCVDPAFDDRHGFVCIRGIWQEAEQYCKYTLFEHSY